MKMEFVRGDKMTAIRYIAGMNRYYIKFRDGSKGWCSQRAIEDLFPDRIWSIVRENDQQWFYI